MTRIKPEWAPTIAIARQHVYDLAAGRARFGMSIPPRAEADSDFVLLSPCEVAESAILDLAAVEAERDEARAHVAELREHVGSLHKATARGMDHERAAVVAWLRGWGSVGRVATADDYADAIERGDHMETQ